MEKEGRGVIVNSRDGKVNIALLFSIVLIFVLTLLYAEAVTITIQGNNVPGNRTVNNSRNINFTFTPVWSDAGENASNCSIYTNSSGVWGSVRNFSVNKDVGQAATDDFNISNNTKSWANFTFPRDGNFTANIGCYTNNDTNPVLNFSGRSSGGSGNFTIFIDSLAPTLQADTIQVEDATEHNVTSYVTAVVFVNVSDNTTHIRSTVWAILNSGLSIYPSNTSNESINRSMTLDTTVAADTKRYVLNLTSLLNFSSEWTSPGPHSVFFCANDTFGRIKCSDQINLAVKGMNVSKMERQFGTEIRHAQQGFSFLGMDMRYGNGSEIDANSFINPTTAGANFTFNINFTPRSGVFIVGARINEGQFGNASNTNFSDEVSAEAQNQVGKGFKSNLTWVDIGKFIPSEVSYEFGIIQIPGTHAKNMYCNGPSITSPGCRVVSECNATNLNIFNHTSVIPTGSACWLRSGSWGVNTTEDGTALTSGFTYFFVDSFSGAQGGDDFGPPEVNITSPSNLSIIFNTSVAGERQIIFNVTDGANSTGLNLTRNGTINVSIWLGGSRVQLFSYRNNTGLTNLTCTTKDPVSSGNVTGVLCNATYNFASNGTYSINITAQDDSNNSNTNITENILILDQIFPVFSYYNFTNSSNFNTSKNVGDPAASPLGTAAGASRAQGDAVTGKIYALANWTDNLTDAQFVRLQFYNATASAWQNWNTTVTAVNGTNGPLKNGGWTNFTFSIPSGHNEFEGENVSFRIIANDTLGNVNNSDSVKNFTILINDTTAPTYLDSTVDGQTAQNGTNTTDATPTIRWNVTEPNDLSYIAVQINSLTDANCGGFKNFTTIATANANRNGSLTMIDTGGCTSLANGTQTVRLTTKDTWGNEQLYIHTFTLQSGGVPALQFSAVTDSRGITTVDVPVVNKTSITSSMGLNFSATIGQAGTLKNLSYVSSCNESKVVTFTNNTAIFPFNESTCPSTSANRTLTVTVFDSVGNSNSTSFGFLVDNVGPSITVQAPANGFNGENNIALNLSAKDANVNISFFGYYLDGRDNLVRLNVSGNYVGEGVNISLSNNTNFTAGTHTIKFTVNDTLNNRFNSSVITFTALGPLEFSGIKLNQTLRTYNTNITLVNLTNASGDPVYDVTSTVTDQILNLFMSINDTRNITITFNASSANWDKYNFSVSQNDTKIANNIASNQTIKVIQMVTFNDSIDNFIPDSGYYGRVKLPNINVSSIDIGSTVKIQWYETTTDLRSPTNVTQCSTTFAPTPQSSFSPCWNNTNNQSIIVFVPHFSHIAEVNETPPTVSVNIPTSTQTEIIFTPNITVSDDTKNCSYSYNSSGGAPSSRITMTLVEGALQTYCIGPEIKNLTNGSRSTFINISFFVYDTGDFLNQTDFNFSIEDTTVHNVSSISINSITSTGAVVTVIVNESVNISLYNSTGAVEITASHYSNLSTFGKTRNITFSSLSASSAYNFSIQTCDRANNCQVNRTVGFRTGAAAAETKDSGGAAASSGGGAAGGGAVTASNVAASAARQWDALEAGATGTLAVNNEKIAVTGVIVDVKNSVTRPSITVESLNSNPYSKTAAAKVFQYLEIKKSNIADSDASKITINFRVSKSWLTTNGIAESDILLWRYKSGEWSMLETKLTSSDGSFAHYQAITPGFSTFAIGNRVTGTGAFAIIDMIRDFYAGASSLTAFDVIDKIRAFYGG